ncbi:uncharacterized protein LOC110684731 isoform X2 [Chenopodium quinoa]|nr:uncharacterized protein LOC110684731 isoform X2 [Chenopodium quinoa]
MASTRFNFKTASSPSSRVLLPCSTTSDSNLLLIGGELQDPSAPYCSTHASREVYKLIPEVSGPNGDIKDIRIELADATIPRMKSGKACPIVEEIGGNLYVLHSRFVHRGFYAQSEIPFEVFDSKIGEWRTLPVPPFFAAGLGIVIYAHAVFGHCFAIETSKECFCFDTIKEEWYCSDNMTSHLINILPMTIPLGLPCFGLDEHGRQLYVGISLLIEPCAYLATPDGTIYARQSLYHVIFKDILPYPYPPMLRNVLIPLKSVQENVIRMCACSIVSHNACSSVSHNDFPVCYVLLVSFFSAKISPSSQQLIYKMISGELTDIHDHPAYSTFLDVFVERKFFLRVPHLGHFFNGPALLL